MASLNGVRFQSLTDRRRSELLLKARQTAPNPRRIRVFGYGSLMWNPCFSPLTSVPAFLPAHERRFCILTTRARGTPEHPGLGLGLVPGPRGCRGVAYELHPETAGVDLEALFEREMGTGVYQPRWLEAESAGEQLPVLVFVVNPAHPQFVGDLDPGEMVKLIAGAEGNFGTCRDYLANTVKEMARLGVPEPAFESLLMRVDAHLSERAD